MKLINLGLIVSYAVAVVALLGPAAVAEPLVVVTFNIRGDFHGGVATDNPHGWLAKSGDHRRDVVLQRVREADPDLLGVQEAYRNQVDELDAALPDHDFYAVGRDDGADGGEHCAIYYRRERFDRLGAGTFWLSETPDAPSQHPNAACPRIVSWVRLRDREADRMILLANTHWDHVGVIAREFSAELLRRRLAETVGPKEVVVVVGDLNVPPLSDPVQKLLAPGPVGLVDSYRAALGRIGERDATYHAFKGGAEGPRIDYVMHTAGLRTLDAAILRPTDDSERLASDHYPVLTTLDYAPR